MTNDKDAPKKAIELSITVNGFTWPEVLEALDERVRLLREHKDKGVGLYSTGHAASHSASVELRNVSREQFQDESIEWANNYRGTNGAH